MTELSSQWGMADVSAKPVTRRFALAAGKIILGDEALQLLQDGSLPKGDPLPMAEIAAIQGAKKTPELLPLCHPISLNRVEVKFVVRPGEGAVEAFVGADIAERTGVEMEALTGLQVALLTIWDLVKPVNPALEITDCRLLFKSGGKIGQWTHPHGIPAEVESWVACAGNG